MHPGNVIDANGHRFAIRLGGSQDGGMINGAGDDSGADASAPFGQAGDRGRGGLDPRAGENYFLCPGPDNSRNHFSCPIERLSGKPARPVQSKRITPPGVLGIEPRSARIRQHRLAGRRIEEDRR